MPKLEIENNQFKLIFPYDEFHVVKARQIPGCKWSKAKRAWFFPLSPKIYVQIKEIFDVSILEVDEMLKPKPIKKIQSRTKLYNHQEEAVRFVLGQFGFEAL
jgi:hypothetical protein